MEGGNMMNISNATSTTSFSGVSQFNDSKTQKLQIQITSARQDLNHISSESQISAEEKAKKRQEIQREIDELNRKLKLLREQKKAEAKEEAKEQEKKKIITEEMFEKSDSPEKVKEKDSEKPDEKLEDIELPAMDNPDLGYYSHSFKMNGNTYRNYTFGWSQKDRVALWVAYPLCKLYTNGNVGRTEAWALDPLLGEDSAAPFGGYAGSYARGHQVASADRQCCYEANAQTYYGTNMTPQLNAHNEKIWSDLEGKVRGYANTSDTTYVVTGVMVSVTSKKEKDSYGQSVTIPDAYFKAVLKYSKSSTMGTWNAAAFYLEHRAYTGSISKEHSMSIDELEKITGFDFFVNLPAKIGADQAAKIEAADPADSSVWW